MGGSPATQKRRINARENLIVKLFNDALSKSKAAAKIKRVGGATEVNYPDTSNGISKSLCDVSGFQNRPEFGCTTNNQAAKFNGVRNKRNATKADLVVLLRVEEIFGFCGLAWLNEFVTAADEQFGFSSVNVEDYCINAHTVDHEAGHNMGLRHDRETLKDIDGNPTNFPNSQTNFGFISDPGLFYTNMGYQASCGNEGDPFDCAQTGTFSNPKVKFNGLPTGIRKGSPGAADAALTIRGAKGPVSQFRK
jgi:hypothetical protein